MSVALTTRVLGEGAVEVGRVEGGQPVPQREVRRRGLLRLQRDDAVDGLDHVERLAAQQQLPGQRGPVELSGGELHAESVKPPRRAEVGVVPRMMPAGVQPGRIDRRVHLESHEVQLNPPGRYQVEPRQPGPTALAPGCAT